MSKKKSLKLYCFSPLVMLSTFVIEISAALYILIRYRTNRAAQLIIALLASLAFFQLAEYMICEQTFLLARNDWARLGYVAITLLPPLGIHLGATIMQKQGFRWLIIASYTTAVLFITFFLFVDKSVTLEQCLGNYVIFNLAPYPISLPLYRMYYLGWLIIGVILFWKAQSYIETDRQRGALFWLVLGYLSFMIPTLIVILLKPETTRGLPSIMCGFAILLALCLVFKVAPLTLHKRP